jgi:hypothetical protein
MRHQPCGAERVAFVHMPITYASATASTATKQKVPSPTQVGKQVARVVASTGRTFTLALRVASFVRVRYVLSSSTAALIYLAALAQCAKMNLRPS